MLNPLTLRDDFRGRLEKGRLQRFRNELRAADCAVGLYYDPINIRYATGVPNMQVYSLHNPCRYVFIAVDGPVILFDFHGCEHLSKDSTVVDEVRDARSWYHFNSGPRNHEHARLWCAEIDDLMRQHGGGNSRIAIDRMDPIGTHLLEAKGYQIVEGQEVAHLARMVKSDEEVLAIRDAVNVCQYGIRQMQLASEPGKTEQQIWSILHQCNIEQGGEWIETRLLSSGQRTNPWYQECSARVIEAGDMISLDSDLVGPHGYSADISRSWICGRQAPTDEQKQLYQLAQEQLQRNTELFKAGKSYRDIGRDAWQLPQAFQQNQLPAISHGIGLCNEYPLVMNPQWFEASGHDGECQAGMIFCIESYVGAADGGEGVKLEQQILVTDSGYELLSDMEFDADLAG
ncbi:MAG: Xaa-Pro dipeptidase [Planctomycetota bacterium]|jgi:Xaa-Pro dipeptidase